MVPATGAKGRDWGNLVAIVVLEALVAVWIWMAVEMYRAAGGLPEAAAAVAKGAAGAATGGGAKGGVAP